MERGQFFQHVGVGAGSGLRLLEDRQLQLVEQQLGELLRRVDVERVAGELFDLALELLRAARRTRRSVRRAGRRRRGRR